MTDELQGIIDDLVGAHAGGVMGTPHYELSQMRTMAKAIKSLREDVTQMMTLADSRGKQLTEQAVPSDPVAAALSAEIKAAIKRAEDAGEHPLQEVTDAMKVQRTRIHDVVDILDNMTPDAFNILMGRK